MKIQIQWALRNPQGWQQIDSSQWSRLPKRPIPKSGQLGGKDNVKGWLRNISIQGITTEGQDHVAIEEVVIGLDTGVKLTTWNDDPDDYPIGERQGIVWTILPLAPDPKLGMAINTQHSCIWYCEGARYDRLAARPPQNPTVRPWSEFVPPPETVTRHGVWLEEKKFREHVMIAPQSEWGWRHWCDHLPDSECETSREGKRVLKQQRAQGRYHQAAHTITYYQRDTNLAIANRTATHEDALSTTTGTAATESATLDQDPVNCWVFTTESNQPNSADWPSGVYHGQLDCTAASAGVVYGLGTSAFGGANAFSRHNAALTTV